MLPTHAQPQQSPNADPSARPCKTSKNSLPHTQMSPLHPTLHKCAKLRLTGTQSVSATFTVTLTPPRCLIQGSQRQAGPRLSQAACLTHKQPHFCSPAECTAVSALFAASLTHEQHPQAPAQQNALRCHCCARPLSAAISWGTGNCHNIRILPRSPTHIPQCPGCPCRSFMVTPDKMSPPSVSWRPAQQSARLFRAAPTGVSSLASWYLLPDRR